MKKKIALSILFCLIAFPVFAATYYLSPTGNDSNPGTESQPWLTIGKAQSSTGSNDIVLLERDGTWNEQLTIPASNMVWSAYGTGAKPILDGLNIRDYCILSNNNSQVQISYLHLKNAKYHSLKLFGSPNWIVEYNEFSKSGSSHISTETPNSAPLIVRNNVFKESGTETIFFNPDSLTNGEVLIDSNNISDGGWNFTQGDGIDIKGGNSAQIIISNNEISWGKDMPTPPTTSYGIVSVSPYIAFNNRITDPLRSGLHTAADGTELHHNYIIQTRNGTAPFNGIEANGVKNLNAHHNLVISKGSTTSDHIGIHLGYSSDGAIENAEIYDNVVYGWKIGILRWGEL